MALCRTLSTILLAGLWSCAAEAATIERVTSFGTVELVEEVRTPDPGEPPMIHVATSWTKLHLRWRSANRAATVEIVDDGETLRTDAAGHDCGSTIAPLRYARRPGEAALWQTMRLTLRGAFARCPRTTAAEAHSYRRAFAGTGDDFVAAVEAMKKRAVRIFRRPLDRCRPDPSGPPMPYQPCRGLW